MNRELRRATLYFARTGASPYMDTRAHASMSDFHEVLGYAKELDQSALNHDYELATMILTGLQADEGSAAHRLAAALLDELREEETHA